MKKEVFYTKAIRPAAFFTAALALICIIFTTPVLSNEERQVTLSVDFSAPVGKIKPVNGTNLGPRLITSKYNAHRELFKNARFGLVRLHDAPWDNPTLRLVDVHMIFGNMNDDPADPANYYFDATDDYVKSILDVGAPIMYRLGVSIEHSAPHTYFAKEPKDIEKTAEIFAGIVRHYNRGWANGFNCGIEYWEIWNEPNIIPMMWDNADFTAYCRFYVSVAKRLKREFPEIKVGGPALAGSSEETLAQFVDYCRKEDAPLDFCSWHTYTSSLSEMTDPPAVIRRLLDERGYTKTELHLDEWHFLNLPWGVVQGRDGDRQAHQEMARGDGGINGIDASAFIACTLALWQDTPIDSANYYATSLMEDEWGLFDNFGYPYKTYYVFQGFGELITFAPNRIRCEGAPENFAILGGTSDAGAARLMIASFKEKADSLKVRLSGIPESGTVRVRSIVPGDRIEPIESTLDYTDGILDLGPITGSSVKFIEFSQNAI